MNTKPFLSLVLVSFLALTSCKKELEPQDDFPTTASPVNPVANNGATPIATQAPNGQMQMQPGVSMQPPVVTAPGMNPPHGQPNHRCDIAVGVPLSTPVTKPATQQNRTTTQIVSSTPAATITPAVINTDGTITPAPTSDAPAILQTPAETAP